MLKYSCGPRMRDALGPKASAQKDVGTGRRETHGPLQQRGYKWTYLYGFVRPESGQVFWMIVPTVNTELFSLALGEFAKEVGVGKERHVLLILDKAGWHTGGDLELPEGMHLEFLPSGSPELQPTQRLWPLTNEALANRLFEEIEQIEQTLMSRCVELLDQSELIKDLTNYHWLSQAA
ncbi:MAG TPA: transposase [Rubrobacter sp.]|jgi:transposase